MTDIFYSELISFCRGNKHAFFFPFTVTIKINRKQIKVKFRNPISRSNLVVTLAILFKD